MGLTGLGSVPPLVVPWWVVAIVPGACAVAVLAAVGGGGPGREQLGEALRAG
ncbi:MAG TPA: hypothetical protein PKB06_00140 [Actinotalea sp.]|nr:hypothetical protein [Actinotalea sp.]